MEDRAQDSAASAETPRLPSRTPSPEQDVVLAPLPTSEFDPDAPTPTVHHAPLPEEDDVLALRDHGASHASARGTGEDGLDVDNHDVSMQNQDDDGHAQGHGTAHGHDGQHVNDPAILDLLAGLMDHGDGDGDDHEYYLEGHEHHLDGNEGLDPVMDEPTGDGSTEGTGVYAEHDQGGEHAGDEQSQDQVKALPTEGDESGRADLHDGHVEMAEEATVPVSPARAPSPLPELPSELPDFEATAQSEPSQPEKQQPTSPAFSKSIHQPHSISATGAPESVHPRLNSATAISRESTLSPAPRDASPMQSPAPTAGRWQMRKRKSKSVEDKEDDSFSASEGEASAADVKPKRKYRKKDGRRGTAVARPRKRLDAVLGITRDNPKPPEKVAPRARTLTDARLKELVKGKTRELQLTPCLRPRYGIWGKCTQCISKVGGDSCRFRNYRIFKVDPETSEIISPGWFESTELEEDLTPLPQQFNTPLTEDHMRRTERTVAPFLMRLINQELRHVATGTPIHRPVDTAKQRSVCDFCASTIFGGFFFCRKCGRDYCMQCEHYFSESRDEMNKSQWPLPDAARPRIHKCTRGGDDSVLPLVGDKAKMTRRVSAVQQHYRGDLVRTSRFTRAEMEQTWHALLDFVLDPHLSELDIDTRIATLGLRPEETELRDAVRAYLESTQDKPTNGQAESARRPALAQEKIDSFYEASKSLPTVTDPSGVPHRPFLYIDNDELSNDVFDALWARGEPIVARNVGKRLKLPWTPEFFSEQYGHEQCFIVDCQTETVHISSIRRFFTVFKRPELGLKGGTPEALSNGDVEEGAMNDSEPAHADPVDASEEAGVTNEKAQSTSPDRAGFTSGTGTNGDDRGDHTPMDTDEPPTGDASEAIETANGNEARSNGVQPETNPASLDNSTAPPGDNPPSPEPNARLSPSNGGSPSKRTSSPPAEAPKMILKLKDWPSTDDFEHAYPELYHDFCDALPVPDYTRRNGVLNLYSHFPEGATRPDIGPKMYNALESREDAGGMGSTRLHMDVADAINIMVHAADRRDGTPGCAVWDLFKAEDAPTIRAFLKEKFGGKRKFTDPIHAQMFYLDAVLRKELYDQHGVTSFRVYQRPGEAVFIPAGCAHQVCNLSSCIKIALDFVSPHNVPRCQELSQDFRKENFVVAWKDDVLQLYNVMWYAWTNVRETRERRALEAAKLDEERAARTAHLAHLARGGTEPPADRTGSPVRTTYLSAMSSVRDYPRATSSLRDDQRQDSPSAERTQRVSSMATESAGRGSEDVSMADHDEDEQSTVDSHGPDRADKGANGQELDKPDDQDKGSTTDTGRNSPRKAPSEEAPTGSMVEDGTPEPTSPKSQLASRLLEAAIARVDDPVLTPDLRDRGSPQPQTPGRGDSGDGATAGSSATYRTRYGGVSLGAVAGTGSWR